MIEGPETLESPIGPEPLALMNIMLRSLPDDLERAAEFKQWVKSGYVGLSFYKEFFKAVARYDGELNKDQGMMVSMLLKEAI